MRIPVARLLLQCSEIDGIRYRMIEEASRNTSMRWCLSNASKSIVWIATTLHVYRPLTASMPSTTVEVPEAERLFESLQKWMNSKHKGYNCRLISKEIPGNSTS